MFRVDYRFAGQGVWNMPALPVTLQAALGQARAREGSLTADEVRVTPLNSVQARQVEHVVNMLV